MAAPMRRVVSRQTTHGCVRCFSNANRTFPSRTSRPTPLLRTANDTEPWIRTWAAEIPKPTLISNRPLSSSSQYRASHSTADEAMEQINLLYENATEEFQIAAEETESNTVYASDDRDAARTEVQKLQDYYESVVNGNGYDQQIQDQVKKRAGGRIRELVNAMTALEERAMHQD